MSQSPVPDPESTARPAPKPIELSGTRIVIGMFALGLFLVSLLFIYFELHTRPFRPLREAIGREFKHSRPNVEGGRVKGKGPRILRISLSVPFDPFIEEQQADERNQRILQIARDYQDLASYDTVEINLIQFVPESEAKRRTFEWTGANAMNADH